MKHPVDVHVGKRIRHRRWMVGMTQQQLAALLVHDDPRVHAAGHAQQMADRIRVRASTDIAVDLHWYLDGQHLGISGPDSSSAAAVAPRL